MPILTLLLLAIDAACIIHAARSGRLWPWATVVVMLPGIGAAAYVIFEFLPEWRRSIGGRRLIAGVEQRLDPDRRLREATVAFEESDTLANRIELARASQASGRWEAAIALWDTVIAHPLGHDAKYHEERAVALLEAGRAAETLAGLDRLRKDWPEYQSQEGHLTYARALARLGRSGEAEAEYRALTGYYAGPTPGVELAELLAEAGRGEEARAVASDYLRRLERSPKFVRRQHGEAIDRLRSIGRTG